MDIKNVLILGSGPAGLTAAIYAARAGLNPILIEGSFSGGQLMITTVVENFPGFPEIIKGHDLINRMKEQARKFGTEFITGDITKVDFNQRPFKLWVDEVEFNSNSVIIATGARAKYLELPSIQSLKGKGVTACATCDGFFYKDKIVYVIGGGNTAAEEALYLANIVKQVYIVHRRDKLRTEKYLQDKLLNHPKINIIWDTIVQEVEDPHKGKVEKIILKNIKTDEIIEKEADGIFMAIGHTPATSVFANQIALDENGYIIVSEQTKTSIPGIFAAGDVIDPNYRQAVTAAGTGCKAAIDVNKYLQIGN